MDMDDRIDSHTFGVSEAALPTSVRKTYQTPKLVGYGAVAKLTQGFSGNGSDSPGMSMAMAGANPQKTR